MPPDRPPLPASVLAALGLVSLAGCVGETTKDAHSGTTGPCLQFAYEHTGTTTTVCLNFVYPHSGTLGPCLDVAPHTGPCLSMDTGHTGTDTHSGGSGGHSGHSGGAAAVAPPPDAGPAVFERLAAEGVLPPDVVERLGRRGR